jgi:inner membrane protein involved in colicin E2 resistance
MFAAVSTQRDAAAILEDDALLTGAVVLFAMLGAVMFETGT